jgi:hypothetical protein
MSQENNNSNENVTNSPEETSNPAEAAIDAAEQSNVQEIENLPIESIGSYARLEELLTDEEKEKTTNPTAQS